MINVVTGTLRERNGHQRLADPMQRLRPMGIHERRGGPGSARTAGDGFDADDSAYLLTTNPKDAVIGGWRLRPTTRSCVLRKVFPDLLYGAPAPMERSIWEISRFSADSPDASGPAQDLGDASRALVLQAIEFAARSGVTQYVMVVSLAVERLLRRMGLRLHRFGPPMHIDRAMSVAVWLDVDLHARSMVPGQPIPLLAAAA